MADQVREDDDEEEENLKEEEVKRPIKQRILAEYEDREDEGQQNVEDGLATAGEGRDLNNQVGIKIMKILSTIYCSHFSSQPISCLS
jgi:predicted transcriptional regulator